MAGKVKEFRIPIGDLKPAQRRVLACAPTTSLKEVLDAMREENIGCVVVVKDKKPVGIMTERDFLKKVTDQGIDLENTPVKDYMTDHPTTVKDDEDLMQVLNFMQLGSFRRVIVVNQDGTLKFVASMKDVIDYLFHTIQAKGL